MDGRAQCRDHPSALSERGDIVRTMQRALGKTQRELVIFDPKRSPPVVGRIADKGLSDELSDRAYVIVDGVDGRAHYARLAVNFDLADFPVGGIVELRGVTEIRRVDRSIAEMSIDGVYRTEQRASAWSQRPHCPHSELYH